MHLKSKWPSTLDVAHVVVLLRDAAIGFAKKAGRQKNTEKHVYSTA